MSKKKAIGRVTRPVRKTAVVPQKVAPAALVKSESSTLKLARDLARLANEYDLQEVEVTDGGGVRVSRTTTTGARYSTYDAPTITSPQISLVPPPAAESSIAVEDDNSVRITSPFVGTFYRASSPDADSFVEVGQVIRKGQVVCIVEAMKLMNEIEAEVDGKLEEILVKNGDHVQYGQALFRMAKQ